MHPRQVACWITHTNDADARHHPRRARPLAAVHRRDQRRRSAVLPLDRGQGRPLRRAAEPPDLPGAGRPRHDRDLPERHLDVVAVRRAARARALDPGLRAAPTSSGPAIRSNTTISIRARCARRSKRKAIAGYSSPGRSTARPATKRPRRRACWPASTQRGSSAGEAGLVPAPRRSVSGRAGRRPDHARRFRALPDVHVACRVPAAIARRQRRPAAHRARAANWAWSTTRAGTPTAASATPSRASSSG